MPPSRVLWSAKTLESATALAQDAVEARLAQGVAQPAATFDIDDTMLFNRDLTEDDLGVAANTPVRALYEWLVSRGVTIFAVTARRRSPWSATLVRNQLHGLGYRDVEGVFMVPKSYDADESASRFKLDARRRLVDEGYTIVLNVGDQVSDHLLMPPFSLDNADFAARLDPLMIYGIAPDDGVAGLSVKLKHTYVVR